MNKNDKLGYVDKITNYNETSKHENISIWLGGASGRLKWPMEYMLFSYEIEHNDIFWEFEL